MTTITGWILDVWRNEYCDDLRWTEVFETYDDAEDRMRVLERQYPHYYFAIYEDELDVFEEVEHAI